MAQCKNCKKLPEELICIGANTYCRQCVPVKEFCVCAAILEEDGTVVRGHRHGDCFQAIQSRRKKPMHSVDAQGFVTSRGRFVTRAEGRKLQELAGIKSAEKEGGYRYDILFSEDLY